MTRYLDFDGAARVIRRARQGAAERGEPDVAPSYELEECDRAKIESALVSPRAGFGDFEKYPSLEKKGAVLAYRLVKAHACVKGNKRVALLLLFAFLYRNGRTIRDEHEHAAEMMFRAAGSAPDQESEVLARLTAWLADVMVPLTGGP